MLHLLLLVYVMILDKTYFEKSPQRMILKIVNYVGQQLGWAGAFRPDFKIINVHNCVTGAAL